MNIQVLGSSSKGNSYLIHSDTGTLLLEAGLHHKTINKALGNKLERIEGVLISHTHADHARGMVYYTTLNIPMLAPLQAYKAKKITPTAPLYIATPYQQHTIGAWKAIPLPMTHDVETYAYYLAHTSGHKILFITDTSEIPHTVQSIDTLMIECNYSTPALHRAVAEGKTSTADLQRIGSNHLALSATKEFITRQLKIATPQRIILLHLSDRNSDPQIMISEVQATSGLPTYIATPGLSIEL